LAVTGALALLRAARNLGAPRARTKRAGGPQGWPPLLLFTDPVRTPDPEALIARMPAGCGVVYRAFGAPDARLVGRRIARLCARRRLVFFVGADPTLAAACGASGLHLPERLAARRGVNLRLARRFRLSAAAHGPAAIARARRAGVEAVVISPVFPSASPSAGRPLGALGFRRLVREGRMPAYALGGITAARARSLRASGAVGLAAVEAFARSQADAFRT
jgi:thiamine-phosphate pyrophosphorylase